MPIAEAITAKTKEIRAHDALCATNSTARQCLENEELCAFIINGPKDNKATYEQLIKTDEVNLNGDQPGRAGF